MTNRQVVESWKNGKKGKSSNGNLRTDGKNLFSYQMLIGTTYKGKKISLNVMSPNFYSITTSQHCSLAKGNSDEIIEPIPKRIGYSVWFNFPQKYL